MPLSHFIHCHPLLLLPSIFRSIRVVFNELGLHIRWPKYWHFSFSIRPSSEYSGLISFQFSSVTQKCPTLAIPWTAACQASLSITNSWSLLRPMSIESVMPSNHLTLCRPLLFPPSIFPSIRVFSDESVLHIRRPKSQSVSFSINPSNEYSGLIFFRKDWFDLLAVQETLKSLLQHHSSKALILQCSFFFIVQLSHPYMTTRKTIDLTIWKFVAKCCLGLS